MADREQKSRSGPSFNRREFLRGSGAAVAASALATATHEALADDKPETKPNVVSAKATDITLNVNGKDHKLKLEPRVTLLDVLRNDLNLTGCKDVDDTTAAGADTVIIDGKAVLAASRLAIECEGQKIITIESLRSGDKVDEVITGFVKHDAQQCGFCTPGFVMAMRAFLNKKPKANLEEIHKGLGGNLCRCGTYAGITACALELAKKEVRNMAERTVSWKPREENMLIGKRHERIDGVEKASGFAKYAADTNTPGTLYAKVLTCKHAHAKIKRLNAEPAKKVPGVHAVHLFKEEGAECQWDGDLVAAVAAERVEQADDGLRAIEVEYEVLEHFVDEQDIAGAATAMRTKPPNTKASENFDEALSGAAVKHSGYYGIHTISHACMEPHGSHCEWMPEGKLNVYLSTQNVSGTGGQFAGPLGLDAANVSLKCDYVGGGFGSKFAADEWGLACANLAKQAGRPVRLMLDRATELKSAGTRPSAFGKITIAADAEGNIVAWDSEHWGTSGVAGGTVTGVVPYLFTFPNTRQTVTGISTNCGPNRAWRAPNHPQGCALTDTVIDDLAAALKMDSYDVFLKNLDKTPADRQGVYAEEMKIGAKLIDWKAKWHPHGQGPGGPKKQGLGMALHTWGGGAHKANCLLKVHPDGAVETFLGSQDIGTGTRTVIAITLAETFGLPISAVRVNIGSNAYPTAGPSGGSTTVGGVSDPNRRAGLEALWKIFDLVAAKHGVDAATLSAKDQKIFSGDKEVCTWQQACSLIGPMPLEVQKEGTTDPNLTDRGVGGIQMADVTVDTEIGKITVNKFVAVQDCGLIIDLMTAESQVYGAMIMGIAYALSEERIMDNKTGRYVNADFENYKLPRIGDIGELVVEMYQPDSEYKRGVIGLGEPPVISCGAALSNAVANAIGVRVPVLPMTPQRVLEALKGAQA